MTDTPASLDAPPGWAEALDESLAELAAGASTVPGEVVHRELQESIARLEAKRAKARGMRLGRRPKLTPQQQK
ncbi:MAG: hypothetical protein HIU82_12990 [Proteobacteria bacterium]|nr:hypothetical protein [Pseudomonadota bacterium]